MRLRDSSPSNPVSATELAPPAAAAAARKSALGRGRRWRRPTAAGCLRAAPAAGGRDATDDGRPPPARSAGQSRSLAASGSVDGVSWGHWSVVSCRLSLTLTLVERLLEHQKGGAR